MTVGRDWLVGRQKGIRSDETLRAPDTAAQPWLSQQPAADCPGSTARVSAAHLHELANSSTVAAPVRLKNRNPTM